MPIILVLLIFIGYSGYLLAQNVMGMVATLEVPSFCDFLYYYQAHLNSKFFRLVLRNSA